MTFGFLRVTFGDLRITFGVVRRAFGAVGVTFLEVGRAFLFVGMTFLGLKVTFGFGADGTERVGGESEGRSANAWWAAVRGSYEKFCAISIPSKTSYNHIEQFWCQMACTDAGRAISVNKCHPLDSPQIYSKK